VALPVELAGSSNTEEQYVKPEALQAEDNDTEN